MLAQITDHRSDIGGNLEIETEEIGNLEVSVADMVALDWLIDD